MSPTNCNDASTEGSDGDKLTLYYDGSCPLCSAEIGHYRSMSGQDALRFVDVSTRPGDLGSALTADQAMKRFHVRRPSGELVSGAKAFIAVWKALPGWRWLARIADLPGMPRVLEVGYRVFLPLRPVLSRIARRCGAKPENAHDPS